MDQAEILGIAIGVGGAALLGLIGFIKANMIICQPNEIVILSGRTRKLADGTKIGYRVIRGGRGFKWPFIESVARLPLNTLPVELHLPKALCEGMIPVVIEGRANVKLAGRSEDGMDNAVERFLGKGVDAVTRTASQVIEGALRGAVAAVSPEAANSRRMELADQVAKRAREDLGRLGIVLDFVQIQSISDDHGYLEAIGRKRNAVIRRDAQIAEAEAEAESRKVAAEQQRIGREAELASEMEIVQKENALAVRRADLEADANRATERAEFAGKIVQVEERLTLETKRVDLSTKQQQADTIIPARAKKDAALLEAEGLSARILENGKATAEAVELMRKQWENGETRELFMIRMFPELLDKMTRVIADNLRIEKLTILDGGDGNGLPAHVKSLTNSAVVLLEQMKNATGIDLAKLASKKETGGKGEIPRELDR
jgi:flotillin